MRFAALADRLVELAEDGPSLGAAWPKIGVGGCSFSDDLSLGGRERLAVRVRITDGGGGYCIDLRDSDDAAAAGRFGLGADNARRACLLALGDVFGDTPHRGWGSRIELLTDGDTWIGDASRETDPARVAFGMARVYDAVLGALANAWPGRVGAGSCSLGVIVEFREPGGAVVFTDVVPGGEGGRPDRPGTAAWPGPLLSFPLLSFPTEGFHAGSAALAERLRIADQPRPDSGGTGKYDGGAGIERSYRATHELIAHVAFDRVDNPPHGLDRAGPPLGTEVSARAADPHARHRLIAPWTDVRLNEGDQLTVRTCGGAGWGFPGYGEIEWDPSEWFGSQSKRPGS